MGQAAADAPDVDGRGVSLSEDVRVRDPDGSVRLNDLPLAILANKDRGHPHRSLTAALIRETPASLSPSDIALDVDVDVLGCPPDVLPVTSGGHGIHEPPRRPPLRA